MAALIKGSGMVSYHFLVNRLSNFHCGAAAASKMSSYNKSTEKVLNQIAKDQGYTDYKLSSFGQIGKGQGLTGDLFFVNIQTSSSQLELLVKQASCVKKIRDYFPVNALYKNESLFYNDIWPKYAELQKEVAGKMVFDNVPKCYGSEVKPEEECVVLENLKSQGFETVPKRDYLSKELFEFIFQKYGELHAISYAYKMKDSATFEGACSKLIPYWSNAKDIIPLKVSIQTLFEKCVGYLKTSGEQQLQNKMKEFSENSVEIFTKSTSYNGKHGVFLHGDCWSNNMMFKFDPSRKAVDMKLIDFQACKVGSPVFDLAYCLYSGGSEETFNELDHFLKHYHDSLTKTCKQLKCDKYISLDELKKEWKEYSRFGWIMALVLLRAKLVQHEANLDLLVMINEFEKRDAKAHLEDSDEAEIEKRTMALLQHLHKNKFL